MDITVLITDYWYIKELHTAKNKKIQQNKLKGIIIKLFFLAVTNFGVLNFSGASHPLL